MNDEATTLDDRDLYFLRVLAKTVSRTVREKRLVPARLQRGPNPGALTVRIGARDPAPSHGWSARGEL